MEEIVEFTIGDLITLRETEFLYVPDENILTELKGWDDGSVQIVTVPKLFGKGSYVVEKQVPEREVVITFFVIDAPLVREIRQAIEAKMLTMNPLVLTRTYRGETETRTETLAAYLTALNEYTTFSDGAAKFVITALAWDPEKEVSITATTVTP
jgi:hypothetical protein